MTPILTSLRQKIYTSLTRNLATRLQRVRVCLRTSIGWFVCWNYTIVVFQLRESWVESIDRRLRKSIRINSIRMNLRSSIIRALTQQLWVIIISLGQAGILIKIFHFQTSWLMLWDQTHLFRRNDTTYTYQFNLSLEVHRRGIWSIARKLVS